MRCPLCESPGTDHYHRDARRDYRQCRRCRLVFVPAEFYLSAAAEKAEYDLHENAVDDGGYRQFLNRLCRPLVERLPAGASGLDFGCGPGPALQAMLEAQGFHVNIYDIYYAPNAQALERRYDFITATEVVEHLHCPGQQLRRLWSLIEPGGWLGIMTKRVNNVHAFATWHYKNDPTHVCFFSEATFEYLARTLNARLHLLEADVALLEKS